jgi:hypothetical protein
LRANRALHERQTFHSIMPMVQWAAIRYSMTPKSGYRFPVCAKPSQRLVRSFDASSGEGRSDKVMLKQNLRPMESVS